MVKIQEKNGQYTVTIPKDIIKLVGWVGGTHITATTDPYGNDVVLRRQK